MSGAFAARYLVGVENIDYRPYQAGHTGTFEGFGRELLDAFAVAADIEFDYLPLPPSRLLPSLLQDRIDFKYPDDSDWSLAQREGYEIHYSRPILGYVDGTLVTPQRLGLPASEIRTLGTLIGFTPIAWRSRLSQGQVSLKENADFTALFQQVLNHRLDAAYANVAVARDQSMRSFGRPDVLRFDPSLPFARGDYRLSTRRHPALIERFDAWIQLESEAVAALAERAGLGDALPD
ncbi:amino acid ABC transporter substrate-binding protein [Thiorhodococcus mannitoliphagus]|uniref:Amino acid ABC transporter substrate-binding protein n=1 Tax=Thiorhodococcus mannitoliphagus TaxID=329406 RepID=A0A6P1DWZ5_9GAMM|nr:transporter substrate-binding domain-containing protein [Thiorhodococcus mannitoliphagus]NEX20224.1 amino acid ABC transporter substrate-binding protein [Thiorhodococcus mannitoliphagus]